MDHALLLLVLLPEVVLEGREDVLAQLLGEAQQVGDDDLLAIEQVVALPFLLGARHQQLLLLFGLVVLRPEQTRLGLDRVPHVHHEALRDELLLLEELQDLLLRVHVPKEDDVVQEARGQVQVEGVAVLLDRVQRVA